MNAAESLSIILPVRNLQDLVAKRVACAIDALEKISHSQHEVVVVDDGSTDLTATVVRKIESEDKRIRLIRHSRPRGIEAAGQTGLERARGELIFIQESNTDLRSEDLQTLFQLSGDRTILAARAESAVQPLSPALVQRLAAWGGDVGQKIRRFDHATQSISLQMIRRPHLKKLRSPKGEQYRLIGETTFVTK